MFPISFAIRSVPNTQCRLGVLSHVRRMGMFRAFELLSLAPRTSRLLTYFSFPVQRSSIMWHRTRRARKIENKDGLLCLL